MTNPHSGARFYRCALQVNPHDYAEQLSKGQRASAVLLVLLLAGPNATDGIVPLLKQAKQTRQFVFSTHNTNLPVLSDAELIIALDTAVKPGTHQVEGRLDPARMGSIDVDAVRKSVEEILEGGKDAFELRRQKYHF